MKMSRSKHGLAVAGVATLMTLSCGPFLGVAVADPGTAPGQSGTAPGQSGTAPGQSGTAPGQAGTTPGQSGTAPGQAASPGQPAAPPAAAAGHGKGRDGEKAKGGKDKGATPAQGKGPGQSKSKPGKGADAAPGQTKAPGNPPGNNGTVKIAGPGDAVGHPSNNPHPGCVLDVEWFGYDAGSDVVSTVTFTPQAPTSDVTIGGTAPAQVFVGGDAAGGGTDLDGRQQYALTFTGTPHPQQGYHVKVTVATPHSLGNDTKTKVFWVEPCAATPATATQEGSDTVAPPATETGTQTETGTATGTATGTDPDTAVREDTTTATGADTVTGTTGTSTGTSTSTGTGTGTDTATSTTAVPTAVDAGEDNALPEWARSPIALVVLAGGAVLAGVALAARRTRA